MRFLFCLFIIFLFTGCVKKEVKEKIRDIDLDMNVEYVFYNINNILDVKNIQVNNSKIAIIEMWENIFNDLSIKHLINKIDDLIIELYLSLPHNSIMYEKTKKLSWNLSYKLIEWDEVRIGYLVDDYIDYYLFHEIWIEFNNEKNNNTNILPYTAVHDRY